MLDINNLLAHKFLVAVYEHEAPFSPPIAKKQEIKKSPISLIHR
jgi:hypothetical protein